MNWTYQNKPFTEHMIGANIGFIYLITNLINGKKYVGMKYFNHSDNKRLWTKKGLAEMERLGIKKSDLKTVAEKKPYTKRKLGSTESDWQDYWGSSGDKQVDGTLKGDIERFGKENFTREIIELVRYKAEIRYLEAKHIILHDAVRRPDYYNGNVRVSVRSPNAVTSAVTRSELYAQCREENPRFAKTHGPMTILVDEQKELAETYANQSLSKEEWLAKIMS